MLLIHPHKAYLLKFATFAFLRGYEVFFPILFVYIQHLCNVLQPEENWQIDIDHLESVIDDRTKALVLVNPSNPCGSCYSKQHLQDFIKGE